LKSLNQILSIIIALLFIYTINFKSFVTISYFVNQAEIIELFCVNKEKPELQCNGKCHLANQLAKVEDDKEKAPFSPTNTSYSLEINLAIINNKIEFNPNINSLRKVNYFTSKNNTCKGYTSFFSPPPKA